MWHKISRSTNQVQQQKDDNKNKYKNKNKINQEINTGESLKLLNKNLNKHQQQAYPLSTPKIILIKSSPLLSTNPHYLYTSLHQLIHTIFTLLFIN
jgi:uncharacterized membrane protein